MVVPSALRARRGGFVVVVLIKYDDISAVDEEAASETRLNFFEKLLRL